MRLFCNKKGIGLRLAALAVMLCVMSASLLSCGRLHHTELIVEILKIGKADCIILTEENYTVMIDCGESDDGEEIIGYLKTRGVNQIDCLIITHFDRDHIGSAATVLNSYPVKKLIEPDYTPENPDSTEYTTYREAIEQNGISPQVQREDGAFSVGAMDFEIFAAGDAVYTKSIDNNYSLLVGMYHEGNSFLFAGDAEKQRLDDLMESGKVKQYDFLKVPHHGNYNKALPDFFAAVAPKNAVITCSAKNQPEEQTIQALQQLGCEVYCTKDSEIRVISKQEGITVHHFGV